MPARIIRCLLLLLVSAVLSSRLAAQSLLFLENPHEEEYQGQEGENEGDERPQPRITPLKLFAPLQVPIGDTARSIDIPNVNITFFFGRDQNEPSVALNPLDPNNIVIGANDYRTNNTLWYYTTLTEGRTWAKLSPLPQTWPDAYYSSDPAIAFNTSGTPFYIFGRYVFNGFPFATNDIVCFSSSDKGLTWGNSSRVVFDSTVGVNAAVLADKNYIAIDRSLSSPFKDRIYVSWIEYQKLSSKLLATVCLKYSTDSGVSWSIQKKITTAGDFQCPIPAIGPNGEVYVTYEDIDSTHRQIHVAISADGGNTFTKDVVVSGYNDIGPLFSKVDAPAKHPVIKGHLRVNSFPSIAVDRSLLHNGRIYLTWAGKGADSHTHIYLSYSDSKGSAWSAPLPVENDANLHPTDKFFPWIAVDNTNGDVGIICYDSRIDSLANELVDAYLLFSHTGGLTFSPIRITDVSFDPKVSSFDSIFSDSMEFIGDYLGMDANNKRWYPAWSDSRSGQDKDLYMAVVRPYAPKAPYPFTAVENSATHTADLSWSYDGTDIKSDAISNYQFHLRREDGAVDQLLPSTARTYNDASAGSLVNHTYYLQVITATGDTSAIVSAGYFPRAVSEARVAVPNSSTAQAGGFDLIYTVPVYNVNGDTIKGLDEVFYIVDDAPYLEGDLNDNQRGKQLDPFFNLPDGYHKVQIVISVMRSDGDTVLSAPSAPVWLYAGEPLFNYQEDFSAGKNIFTPFAWDTTSANGLLPSRFINDSLPQVAYNANTDSWFVLPPVLIGDAIKSFEFDHEALVASGDSAIIEYSTDNGVHFFERAFYDKNTYPDHWHSDLATSSPMADIVSTKEFNGQPVIARFRLATHSSNGDGWFIGNIRTSDKASVRSLLFENDLKIIGNPVREHSDFQVELSIKDNARISISLVDMLGRSEEERISIGVLPAGVYRIKCEAPDEAGAYTVRCSIKNVLGYKEAVGRLIVLPK